jgi:predicted metal-dependent phosphoesterase TrpH
MFLDLHTHTLASDGKLNPEQLVKKSKQLGILYLAKTDHDTVNLMPAFMAAGKKYGVKTIPGMEISSRYLGRHLHLTALGINYEHSTIEKYTAKVLTVRRDRAMRMAKNLTKQGWYIKWSELRSALITRPHVANSVIRHKKNQNRLQKLFGHLPSFSEFIKKYLVEGKAAYVKKEYYITPKSALKMVHEAGGLLLVAHPASRGEEFCYPHSHLIKLAKFGFDGLEVYAREHTASDIKYLTGLAKKNNLLISGGSDYHGDNNQTHPLGVCYLGHRLLIKHCQDLLTKLKI